MRTRALWILLCGVLLLTAAPAAAVETDGIDGPEDFTLLAGDGYTYGVPGDPVSGYTTLPGTTDNTYSWSGLHLDPDGPGGDPGMLLMATLQNTFDFTVPYASRLGQIWRYDIPSTGDPRAGTWTLAWESGVLLQNLFPVPECVGLRGATVTDIGGVTRAVFSCTGGRGKLIHTTDGVTFSDASTSGLSTAYIGFRDIAAVDHDGDGTDDAIYISPVGVANESGAVNTDLSPNPVMLVNTDPFTLTSRWREASEPGFGNPDNFVNFAVAAFDTDADGRDDAVGAVASNRAGGAELYVATQSCATGPLGGLLGGRLGRLFGLGECDMDWELVFDGGVGKPLVDVGGGDVRSPNAYGSAFAQQDGVLYVTLGETAFPGNDEAADETEIVAVHPPDSASCPAGADCGDWVVELVMGDARALPAASSTTNFHCTSDSTVSHGDWCIPTSHRVASFGDVGVPGTDTDWGGLAKGSPFYSWRAATDGDDVWFTTAGSSGGRGGFELWRLEDDGSLVLVDGTGFGDSSNIGGRTLFFAEPLGIVVGTATRSGGADVFVGGCYDGPPIADVGDTDQLAFDFDENGFVDVDLDGSGSRGAPCDDLTELSWYTGTCDAGDARPSGSQIATWSSLTENGFGEHTVPDVATGGGVATVDFALFAVSSGGTDCTDHTVTTSSNLPPEIDISDVTGATETCGTRSCGYVIVDTDGDELGTLDVTSSCVDPDGDTVVTCEWSSSETDSDITPPPVLFGGGTTYDQDPAGETIPVAIDATGFEFGAQCTEITGDCGFETQLTLRAEDANGFVSEETFFVSMVTPSTDVQIRDSTRSCTDSPGAVNPGDRWCIVPATAPVAGRTVDVEVQVENDGTQPETFRLRLTDSGGGTISPAQITVTDAPPFSVDQTFTFEWTPAAPGQATLTASIPGFDDDEPADNSASKTFAVAELDPDVDAEVVDISTGSPATTGELQTVTVTVRNNGVADATFDVDLLDGPGGPSIDGTRTVTALTPGATTDVTFDWTPGATGPDTLVAEVTLTGDEIPDNDTLDEQITVEPAIDAAVESVSTTNPATTGELQTVTVTVRNNGVADATFDVDLLDGPGGPSIDGTRTVTALAPGATTDVTFDWTPGATGPDTLVAEVTLTGDEIPDNDTLDRQIAVQAAVVTTHLASFTGTLGGGRVFRTAQVTVSVVDSIGAPVAGATVTFSYTRGILASSTTTCVTGAAGTCSATGTMWFGTSSTWTVSGVTATGTVYEPGDNTVSSTIVLS